MWRALSKGSSLMKLAFAGFVVGSLAGAAPAQTQTIDWFTLECGGVMSNAQFELRAVIGQPDAAPAMSGSGFTLTGGFLVGSGSSCIADMDDGTATGTPDAGVGIEDLLYYLAVYDAGTSRADVDNGSGTGIPDGGVGIEDLLYYLARYDAGC
jgi:hypothetical protein